MHTKGRGTKLWENSVEVNFFFNKKCKRFVTLHSAQYCVKGETVSWEHRLFIHATPRTSTGKAVPSQSSEGCSNLAIFQTTFPPSIHLSPAYGKLEIPGEGCSLCLWCGNDMEVQPLGATAATLLLQKIVLTLQILSNLWQEGNISEARSGL